MEKREPQPPITEEIRDPKPPIVHATHMESRNR